MRDWALVLIYFVDHVKALSNYDSNRNSGYGKCTDV